jgi:site-specific recombinase XerD
MPDHSKSVAGPMGRGVALVHSYMRWSRWNEVGTPMDPDDFSHSFARLCERAGLGHWHPDELRHSGASLMLAQGSPLHAVSEVLGHASIAITKDVYGEPVQRAIAQLRQCEGAAATHRRAP